MYWMGLLTWASGSPFAPHRAGDQVRPVDQHVTLYCQGTQGKVLADAGWAGRVKQPRQRKPQHLVIPENCGRASKRPVPHPETVTRNAGVHVTRAGHGRLKCRNTEVIYARKWKGGWTVSRSAILKYIDDHAFSGTSNAHFGSDVAKVDHSLVLLPRPCNLRSMDYCPSVVNSEWVGCEYVVFSRWMQRAEVRRYLYPRSVLVSSDLTPMCCPKRQKMQQR
jgi:hypothetical protein